MKIAFRKCSNLFGWGKHSPALSSASRFVRGGIFGHPFTGGHPGMRSHYGWGIFVAQGSHLFRKRNPDASGLRPSGRMAQAPWEISPVPCGVVKLRHADQNETMVRFKEPGGLRRPPPAVRASCASAGWGLKKGIKEQNGNTAGADIHQRPGLRARNKGLAARLVVPTARCTPAVPRRHGVRAGFRINKAVKPHYCCECPALTSGPRVERVLHAALGPMATLHLPPAAAPASPNLKRWQQFAWPFQERSKMGGGKTCWKSSLCIRFASK